MNDSPNLFDDQRLFSSPEMYPFRINFQKQALEFCKMTPASYKQSAFLDHRIAMAEPQTFDLPLSACLEKSSGATSETTRFIFHSAFCCSTLLSRYLDALPSLFVLREPHSLYEVATIKRFQRTPLAFPMSEADWPGMYRFVVSLLSRRFSGTDYLVIKPTDGCNNLMAALLSDEPGNRGIFMYSALERFLASVLKQPDRHEWARIRLREFMLDTPQGHWIRRFNPQTLNTWQTATLVWLLHMEKYREAATSACGERLRALDCDTLLAQPVHTVTAVLRHFGIPLGHDAVTAALDDEVLNIHSKAPDLNYNKEKRETDFREASTQLKEEVTAGKTWATELAGDAADFRTLPNRLTIAE